MSINHIVVSGNVGRDAEVKVFNEKSVTSFSMGVYSGKDKPTSWFNVTGWGDWFAKAAPKKGAKVYVSGSLVLREFTRKDGTKGMSAEIKADSIDVVGAQTEPTATTDSSPDDDVPF